MSFSFEIPKDFSITLDLKKRQEKTILKISENDLISNKEKLLSLFKKECIDLHSWFYIIIYYYSKSDYSSFKKFSEELSKIDIEENPFYKDQKQIFIYISNILSLFFHFISLKSKTKEVFENSNELSTSLVNQAEKIATFDPMTMICKGFLLFSKDDFEGSDRYFSNISDNPKNLEKNILILAKLGRALCAYNLNNYKRAIEFFTSLIKDYDYYNENVLESIGICFYNSNNIKKAVEIFEKIQEKFPNNYKIKTYLSIIKLTNLEDNINNNNNNNNENYKNNIFNLIEAFKLNNFSDLSIPSLLISLCNILLISNKISEAKIFCQKLNDQLEYAELKFQERSEAPRRA